MDPQGTPGPQVENYWSQPSAFMTPTGKLLQDLTMLMTAVTILRICMPISYRAPDTVPRLSEKTRPALHRLFTLQPGTLDSPSFRGDEEADLAAKGALYLRGEEESWFDR